MAQLQEPVRPQPQGGGEPGGSLLSEVGEYDFSFCTIGVIDTDISGTSPEMMRARSVAPRILRAGWIARGLRAGQTIR